MFRCIDHPCLGRDWDRLWLRLAVQERVPSTSAALVGPPTLTWHPLLLGEGSLGGTGGTGGMESWGLTCHDFLFWVNPNI